MRAGVLNAGMRVPKFNSTYVHKRVGKEEQTPPPRLSISATGASEILGLELKVQMIPKPEGVDLFFKIESKGSGFSGLQAA